MLSYLIVAQCFGGGGGGGGGGLQPDGVTTSLYAVFSCVSFCVPVSKSFETVSSFLLYVLQYPSLVGVAAAQDCSSW